MNRELKFRAWDGNSIFEVAQITFNDSEWSIGKGRGEVIGNIYELNKSK